MGLFTGGDKMKDIPETIFLQIDEYGKDAESFKELETTYCEDKIYEDDIEYILKSKHDELEQQNEQMIEELIMIYKTWHEDSILISSTKPIIESVTGKKIKEIIT